MQNKYVAGFLEKQGVCDGLICLGRPTQLGRPLSVNQEAGLGIPVRHHSLPRPNSQMIESEFTTATAYIFHY